MRITQIGRSILLKKKKHLDENDLLMTKLNVVQNFYTYFFQIYVYYKIYSIQVLLTKTKTMKKKYPIQLSSFVKS
jgi:hypothetical protein